MTLQHGPTQHLFRRATDLTAREPEDWETVLTIPEYVLLTHHEPPTVESVQAWALKAWLDDVRDHGGEPLSQPTLRVWEDPHRGRWCVIATGLVKATVRVSALAAENADLKATTAVAVEDAERWSKVAESALARAAAAERAAKDWELRTVEAEGINERIALERMLRLRSWITTSTVALAGANAALLAVLCVVLVLVLG